MTAAVFQFQAGSGCGCFWPCFISTPQSFPQRIAGQSVGLTTVKRQSLCEPLCSNPCQPHLARHHLKAHLRLRRPICAANADGYTSAEDDVQKPKRGRRKNIQAPLETAEDAGTSSGEKGGPSKQASSGASRGRSKVASRSRGATAAAAGDVGPVVAARVGGGRQVRSSEEAGSSEDDDDDEEEEEAAWPPLVACLGEAVREFVPTVRVSTKKKMHPDAYSTWKGHQWSPPEFVRAPGGPPSNVAISLSRLGGRTAFLGKVGEDALGREIVREMNVNGVQTRGVRFEKGTGRTAVTRLNLQRKGDSQFAVEYTELSAGCMLQSHEVDADLLKEAAILHFGATSVLQEGMRATLGDVLARAKQHGTLLFFDPNFPAPLWHSPAHTWEAIRSVWQQSHIIEVTKQELEFLLGEDDYSHIKEGRKSSYYSTVEELSKDRDEYHYHPSELEPLWHSDLRLLLVTDGTYRIHFYTPTFHGSVKGGEDVLLCPLTCDRTGSGDAIVAGVLRKLSTIPKLWEDQERLERSLRFAICAGVIAQWTIGAVRGFPTERAAQNLTENLFPPWLIDAR